MDIKGYIVMVVCVCVSSSIVTLLAPEGESGIGRQVRVAAGIVTALAVIAPLIGMIEEIGEIDISGIVSEQDDKTEEYQSIFEGQIGKFEEENTKDGIKSILEKSFDIDPSECSVAVSFDEDNGEKRLKRVSITLYGSAIWSDSSAIEGYLRELLECEIILAVGK